MGAICELYTKGRRRFESTRPCFPKLTFRVRHRLQLAEKLYFALDFGWRSG